MQPPPANFRKRRSTTSSQRLLRYLVLAPLFSLATLPASADEAALSVPVRILAAPQAAAQMEPMMVDREPSPEATPAARMPQYQLHHRDLVDPGDPDSPQLRLVLAVPEQPLLIEASIFIDGQPFRQVREKRIQEIMRYIADPEAFKADAARIASETQAEADAKNSQGLLQSISDLFTGETPAEETGTRLPEPTPVVQDSPPTEEVEADVEKPEVSETPAADTAATEPAVAEAPAEPAVPAVPKYAAPATIYERIDRYTQSIGAPPSVDEVRWLLTNWVDGPTLLLLNDNFQRFRADQQPVYRVLDRDRDGIVSADELSKSVASFMECDLNRDDIVEATELAQVAGDPRDKTTTTATGKLVFRLPDEASAAAFLQRLAGRYAAADSQTSSVPRFDVDGNGALSADELKQLYERPADIRLRIVLSTSQPDSSRLEIEGFGDEFTSLKDSTTLNPSSLTLSFPTFNLEFLAAQASGSDQISIGAVNDGYAMLQEIDPNTDGRFSIRELRQLNARLAAFDRNSDGEITSDETHPTFRVCIGLGPTAHQPLALLREVHAPESASQTAGPDWFTEMDKNKDDDLTRQEFPGTDEQFKLLDSDGDELISAAEASVTSG